MGNPCRGSKEVPKHLRASRSGRIEEPPMSEHIACPKCDTLLQHNTGETLPSFCPACGTRVTCPNCGGALNPRGDQVADGCRCELSFGSVGTRPLGEPAGRPTSPPPA